MKPSRCSDLFQSWLLYSLCVSAALCACVSLVREPIGTEGNAAERIAAEPDATEPAAWQPSESERYAAVEAAIGPPPTNDAVPVLGYVTKGGAKYPPRWRTRPDADRGNNLKGQ